MVPGTLPVTHFLQPGSVSQTSTAFSNSAANWGPNVQTREPMVDVSQSNHGMCFVSFLRGGSDLAGRDCPAPAAAKWGAEVHHLQLPVRPGPTSNASAEVGTHSPLSVWLRLSRLSSYTSFWSLSCWLFIRSLLGYLVAFCCPTPSKPITALRKGSYLSSTEITRSALCFLLLFKKCILPVTAIRRALLCHR